MHRRLSIVIVTPALADANNGNWQTARRWARLLRGTGTGAAGATAVAAAAATPIETAAPDGTDTTGSQVRLASAWDGGNEALMIALHARRSASSIAAWKRSAPGRPLVVVLTGTDLYRDIVDDADAQASLRLADRLVVLNELGARALPPPFAAKARVVLQSCSARRPRAVRQRDRLHAVMVGHLREEKSPRTYFAAARHLRHRTDIHLDHVGAALDPALGDAALALMDEVPAYRWLGALSHAETRRRILAADVLVHPSRIEGGAHVVTEAIRSGTPVIASRIDGNVGLLGEDYGGYVPVDDGEALAAALVRLRDDPAILDRLRAQCAARAPRFDPAAERAALRAVLADLIPLESGAAP